MQPHQGRAIARLSLKPLSQKKGGRGALGAGFLSTYQAAEALFTEENKWIF
jgi:hypothetical protein